MQELAIRNMAMGQAGAVNNEAAPSAPTNGWPLLASASLACILLAILLLPFLSQSNNVVL